MYTDIMSFPLQRFVRSVPLAVAVLRGSDRYPRILGTVKFYQTNVGVAVIAEVTGLPAPAERCAAPVFAFHIHTGASCSGTAADPFADALTHYDSNACPHPYHAGDLPPLFGASGFAFSAFLTDRFTVDEVMGKTVVIHGGKDDFSTQPAGNAGERIACGVILPTRRR